MAPIFNDKHLSWSWEHALDMVAESQELGSPMSGGSGLSVTWRMPSIDLPYGAGVSESLIIGPGWADGGSYHMVRPNASYVTAFCYAALDGLLSSVLVASDRVHTNSLGAARWR